MQAINHKLKNIVHFICRECSMTPDRLGKTRLHKIVYYSDLYRLQTKAKTISDAEFIKNPHGPCIADLDDILSELIKEGKLTVIARPNEDEYETIGLIGKGTPDMSEFEDREVRIIKEQIDAICGNSASYISDKSHGPIWEMTEMGERMSPLAELAYRLIHVTDEDIAYAASLPEQRPE